jgi:hypothetical protein
MPGEDLIVLAGGDAEDEVRRELDRSLGADRQRQHRRFLMAALGSIPWVGGFIAGAAAWSAETDQQRINELQQDWLEEHRQKDRSIGLYAQADSRKGRSSGRGRTSAT